ncbi:hypothetical protein AND_001787 [Anopheles darlingi]|uniref:Uncharacterized protein n=1 Tax=Anopheles darlingi TaxID=43151 RepID=W5JQQ6_ANODA|nr:hypothetical protein AND_001787 [Anopheles darlingi]
MSKLDETLPEPQPGPSIKRSALGDGEVAGQTGKSDGEVAGPSGLCLIKTNEDIKQWTYLKH